MAHYIALIHTAPSGDLGVSFPDLPGVITVGGNLDEARALAEEALAFHVEGMIADGDPVPEPSSIESVMSDGANRDGVVLLVPLKLASRRSVRVNITMPEDKLGEIDRYAEDHGWTRSGLLLKGADLVLQSPAA